MGAPVFLRSASARRVLLIIIRDIRELKMKTFSRPSIKPGTWNIPEHEKFFKILKK